MREEGGGRREECVCDCCHSTAAQARVPGFDPSIQSQATAGFSTLHHIYQCT